MTCGQTSLLAVSACELMVSVRLTNADQLTSSVKSTAGAGHTCVLLIGDDDNNVVYKAKIRSLNTAGNNCIYCLPSVPRTLSWLCTPQGARLPGDSGGPYNQRVTHSLNCTAANMTGRQ